MEKNTNQSVVQRYKMHKTANELKLKSKYDASKNKKGVSLQTINEKTNER